ncbi:PGN_0703 family putative restriction endonuclease [Galbibacter sp.]|uniref:PGN_0703 family putative restriction endonuclease n=1 Tax=Galbibacter sp. TaxID=2918471 RepID=UPI003A8F42D2
MNSSKIQDKIIKKAVEIGLKTDIKGYVSSNFENLISTVNSWEQIEKELEKGQGNELKPDRYGNIPFNAVHSSSALCVNNFGILKKKLNEFTFLNYSSFSKATFEKKLPTGISTPNLDFYLENENAIIGIESKFTETLKKKLPNKDRNLEKYLNRKKLEYLPKSFQKIIKNYIASPERLHLDVAQLIKHSIGLINASKKSDKNLKPVLVYIYWLPENWIHFDIFKQHNIEINEFKNSINEYIDFVPMSYLEFWNHYGDEKTFKESIYEMRKRYELKI